MKKFNLVYCIVLLVVLGACHEQCASDIQKNVGSLNPTLPQDLMFNGKPIDPRIISEICFGDSSRFEPINIKNWLNETTEKIDIAINGEGFIGCEVPDEEVDISWKHQGTMGNDHIIEVHETGKTFATSSIFLMSRNGATIRNVGDFTGGNRAVGGINNAYLKNNTLFIWQITTDQDIFLECLAILAEGKSIDLRLNKNKEHETLESVTYRGKVIPVNELFFCNACSAGKILTAWENTKSRQVVGFELDKETFAIDPHPENYPLLQKCFDIIYKTYLQKQELLDPKYGGSGDIKILNKIKMAQFAKDVLDLYLSSNSD